jgi:non-ribosomal peptide synthetase component F
MMVQPLTVDSSVTVLWASLLSGGTLHVIGYEASLDAKQLTDYTLAHSIDCLKIAPRHLQSIMNVSDHDAILPRKRLIVGGDISHWEWIDEIRRVSACQVFNHYGPTETTVGATVFGTSSVADRGVTGGVPIGRPLRNVTAYILSERMELVPVGVAGELYIGGSSVARGYLKRAGLTAGSFIADPFTQEEGRRLYRTGDRARFLSDGHIEFLGRADQQIKLRGYRIELEEIANVLMEHEDVRQAAVIRKALQPS